MRGTLQERAAAKGHELRVAGSGTAPSVVAGLGRRAVRRPTCSCGWKGSNYGTAREANIAANDHARAVLDGRWDRPHRFRDTGYCDTHGMYCKEGA